MEPLKFVIFGLTPRAGQRHHLFLVPSDLRPQWYGLISKIGHDCVTRLANVAPQELRHGIILPNAVVVGDEVIQPTTGRRGLEWLCVASLGVSDLTQQDQERVLGLLRSAFSEFQSWISASDRDWGGGGAEVMACPALNQRMAAFTEFFPDKPFIYPSSKDSAVRQTSSRRHWTFAFIMFFVPLALFIAVQNPNALRDFLNRVLNGKKPPRDPALAEVAQAVGLPDNAHSSEIAERLKTIALDWPSSQSDSELIQSALLLIDKEVNERKDAETPSSLEDLASFDSIRNPLSTLFPRNKKYQFDALGLLRTGNKQLKDLAIWAETLDYQTFKSLFCNFAKLRNIRERERAEIIREFEKYRPKNITERSHAALERLFQIFSDSEIVQKLCNSPDSTPKRLFFVAKDFQALNMFRQSVGILAEIYGYPRLESWQDIRSKLATEHSELIARARKKAEEASDPVLGEAWRTFAETIEQFHSQLVGRKE